MGNLPAKDKRLSSKSWRKRVGFDNIDPNPRTGGVPVEKYVSPAERILDAEDAPCYTTPRDRHAP